MCATFIGSTFSHRPLPGVRKSGIPEGTEIPAPVRTTARSAWPQQVGEAARVGRGGGGRHFPWNFGWRLPRKAPMPSFASSDPNTLAKPSPSTCEALVELGLGARPS